MKCKYFFIQSFIILLIITNCVTIVKKYDTPEKYKVFNVSFGTESTFTIKKDKKGKTWGELTSPLLFKATLFGEIKDLTNDEIEFDIDSIKYFANWPNGWTEGASEAYGKLIFKKQDNEWFFTVIDKFEFFDVVKGQIKYFDSYYRDEDGFQKVKDRMFRLSVIINYLKTQNLGDCFGHIRNKTKYGMGLKKVIQPFLFPETVSNKPEDYKEMEKSKKSELNTDATSDTKINKTKWALGEDILWNKDYTKKYFPEYLYEARNTGSMWRDYEEAKGLMMMLYNIDYYYNTLLPNSIFKNIK